MKSLVLSDYILPPGGAGIFTHSSAVFPTTYTTPQGDITTYETHHSVVTSQPNVLHGLGVFRIENNETYPVFFTTSIPGVFVGGSGRNYVATVNVPNLRGGHYVASSLQRLLHYEIGHDGEQSSTYLTVGGTDKGEIFDRYLGKGSQINIGRGANKLWKDGGLLFSPPFR